MSLYLDGIEQQLWKNILHGITFDPTEWNTSLAAGSIEVRNLIRRAIAISAVAELTPAQEEEASEIYEALGGVPFAIKQEVVH